MNLKNLDHWTKYQKKNCQSCWAACCTMPVEMSAGDLIRLGYASEEELSFSLADTAKRLLKSHLIQDFIAKKQIFVLSQKPNSDCINLGADRRCQVYDQRPRVCREFPRIGPRPGYCPRKYK